MTFRINADFFCVGNTTLKGKMDWFIWKPVTDYSGVNDPPY
jgi:hypothetical protein